MKRARATSIELPNVPNVPNVATCAAAAQNARARGHRSRSSHGKVFWRSIEKSWSQTADMLSLIEDIERFLGRAA